MVGIILAAGTSRRLGKYTKNKPKCLIDVGGKEILGRILENVEYSNIKEIVIVVGYEKDKIIHYCQSQYSNLNISFINNVKWYETNNAYSLNLALQNINDDILVINGDVVCYKDLVKDLVNFPYKNAMAVVRKKELNEEDMKVQVDSSWISEGTKLINQVSKELNIKESYGEFTGIFKLEKEIIQDFIDQLSGNVRKNKNCWFEHALDLYCFEGIMYLKDVSHYPYIEIDNQEDLEEANDKYHYNHPVWEQGRRHGSLKKGERNLKDALTLMVDFRNLCNKYEVKYWLNWGLLLGCVREGQPMIHDTDLDICIDKKYEAILWKKIVPEMRQLRCFVPSREAHCDNDCFIIRDGEGIECNSVEKIGDRYVYSPDRCNLYCPAHHIDTLVGLVVRGKKFMIPSDVENYLEGWYGHWQVPSNTKPKSF